MQFMLKFVRLNPAEEQFNKKSYATVRKVEHYDLVRWSIYTKIKMSKLFALLRRFDSSKETWGF